MPVSNEELKRLSDKEIACTNRNDWVYLRDKGYTREQIRAIWDRDLALGKPAQKHLTGSRHA
jgi:hypothetical protein